MKADIYIVRHGQDEDNANNLLNGRRDTPLTKLGRKQAMTIGDKLVGLRVGIILSSPLRRAHETATIIAGKLGIDKVIIEPDLIEREFGVMTGKPVNDIAKLSSNNLQADKVLYFIDPKGAEPFPELLKRGRRVLNKVKKLQSDQNILLVTHGDIGKMIRATYYGWTWEKVLLTPYLDNTGIIKLNSGEELVE